MKMNQGLYIENALDWIGASIANGCELGELCPVDRTQLREQFLHSDADDEDIEAIADEIERICEERLNPA